MSSDTSILSQISFLAKIFGLMSILIFGAIKRNESFRSPALHRLIFHFEEQMNELHNFKADADNLNVKYSDTSKKVLKDRLPLLENKN